jgi:hypothetical protein
MEVKHALIMKRNPIEAGMVKLINLCVLCGWQWSAITRRPPLALRRQPDPSCKECSGFGHIGIDVKHSEYIPCDCCK